MSRPVALLLSIVSAGFLAGCGDSSSPGMAPPPPRPPGAPVTTNTPTPPPPPVSTTVDFQKDLWPLFEERCLGCHGEEKQMASLRVDSLVGLQKGGDSGPAVVPGQPDRSNLIKVLSLNDPEKRMPKDGEAFSGEQVAMVRKWIAQGARWQLSNRTRQINSGNAGSGDDWDEFNRQLMGQVSGGDDDDQSSGFDALMGGPGGAGGSGGGGSGDQSTGFGGMGSGGGPPPPPPGYSADAQQAFQDGAEHDALQYLLAHALTNEEGANELLPTMRWVPHLRRPAMAVRIGFGVHLQAPRKFDEDPYPIGSTQEFEGVDDGPGGGGFSGGSSGGSGDFGSGGGSFSGGSGGGGGGAIRNDTVSEYTGEFGEIVLDEFYARVYDGYLGTALQEAPMPAGQSQGGFSEFASGGSGDFGSAPDFASGGAGGRGSRAPAPRRRLREVSTVEPIAPGISFIGMSDAKNGDKELLDKAAEEGVDVLALFRVTIKKNPRKEFITNDTVLSLYDPKKDVQDGRLAWTRSLQNIRVQRAREEEEDDGIATEVRKITSFFDENLSLAQIPGGVNSDNVQQRVSALAAGQHHNMLEVLTEISFWHQQGLLSEQSKLEAFQALLGDGPGAALASGTEDEKKEAISNWLPGNDGSSRSRSLPRRS